MRPVNLIPPDERRGDSAPLRTGNMVYVLLAGLAVLLLGIVAVALTSKQISDRESQKASLAQDLQRETARANSLAAFSSFRAVQEQRASTVQSLAVTRFDWQRVLHELALVLPSNVHLDSLTGSVNPEVQIDGGGDVQLRTNIPGPALEIDGCAPSQDAVAGFVSDLEDIDGVTRVGLQSSQNGASTDPSGASSSGSSGGSTQCVAGPPKHNFSFEIVVAFDSVPTPPTATTAPSVPSAVAPASGSDAAATGSDGSQVSDGQSEEAVARASTRVATSKADKAKSTLLPGG